MPLMSSQPQFYVSGGTLPPDASSYVERAADRELLSTLLRGEYCFVLNSRQMGKSSLSVRTMGALNAEGIRTVFLDLTRFGGATVLPEQWYVGMLAEIGRSLNLRKEVISYWKEHPDEAIVPRFFGAIRDVALNPALASSDKRLVLFIDEIDAVRGLSFSTDEFLAALRECYNRRVHDEVMKLLTVCLVGTATPSDLIADSQSSPFNIGRRIELKDFTLTEMAPLAEGLSRGKGGDQGLAALLLACIFRWTNGHPYLTQTICSEIAANHPNAQLSTIDSVVASLFFDAKARERNPNLADVSNRVLSSYQNPDQRDEHRAAILDLYRTVLRGRTSVVDDETNRMIVLLKLAGITTSVDGRLRVRNRIYETVFDREWIERSMPDSEVRRQRAAYRRGVTRAAAIAIGVVAVMGLLLNKAINESHRANALALKADRESKRAQQAELAARREAFRANRVLYVTDMNLAQQAWENNSVDRVVALLGETRDNPDRGWEWGYWNRLCHMPLRQFDGSSGAYLPAKGKILAGKVDRFMRVYDAGTGMEVLKFQTDQSNLVAGCVSRDGDRAATISTDNTIAIWDLNTGKKLVTLKEEDNVALSAAFSPDRSRILTAGRARGQSFEVHLWDALSGRRLKTLQKHEDYIKSVAFSPDGSKIASTSIDGSAFVRNLDGGQDVKLRGHRSEVNQILWFPDGRRVVTAGADKTARIWDASSGRMLLTLSGHDKGVRSVAVSPDQSRVATGGSDKRVQIWDAVSGKRLFRLNGPFGEVISLDYTQDGRRILVGSLNYTVQEWDAVEPHETLEYKGQDEINNSRFSPDGKRIIGADKNGTAHVWDAVTRQTLLSMKTNGMECYNAVYSPDGKSIATVYGGGTVKIWNAGTGAEMQTIPGHSIKAYGAVAFSPDGRRIALLGSDTEATIQSLSSGGDVVLKGHSKGIRSFAFSADGNRIVTASDDATIRIWDTETGREVRKINTPTPLVTWGVAYSHDGKLVATASADGVARIWDSPTGKLLIELKGHSSEVCSVAFASDDKRILTASKDGTAKIWNTETGQELLTLNHPKGLWSASFSADGSRIATACFDGIARVWISETALK